MGKRSKTGKCIYCGKVGKLTKDHIPPKNIFPRPRPNNLIVVPSCKKCNEAFSKDDEYFRVVLTMRYDTYENSTARENWPSVFRSFKRPEGAGFTNSILSTLKETDIYSAGGIYLGITGMYQIDMSRVLKVVLRIVEGIYYGEKGISVPSAIDISLYPMEDFYSLQGKAKEVVTKIVNAVQMSPVKIIGDDVFAYQIRYLDDNEYAFGSILTFFKHVSFLALGILTKLKSQ